MKKLTILALALLVGPMAVAAQAAPLDNREREDPDSLRVLWSKVDPPQVVFVPQDLIGDLDLSSAEAVDLSHLPLSDSQQYALKFFLLSEPDGPDGCFLLPIAGRAQAKGFQPVGLKEFLARKPLASIGVVRKIVPGWATGIDMPANLVFVEVQEPLRDVHGIAVSGQFLVFIQVSGAELTISGRRYCSPQLEPFETKVGSQVVLYGVGWGREPDTVIGGVFEIRDEMVYPGSDSELRQQEVPVPVWQVREHVEDRAEADQ
jgi:hypothetical protein